MAKPDVALLVGEVAADDIVDGQLDGLLGGDTDELRQDTRVEAAETLVADHLPEAVDRIVIQPLAGIGAALVLHARLDEIDRVHHEGTEGAGDAAEAKVVRRLDGAREEALALGLGLEGTGVLTLVAPPPRRIEHLGEVSQAQAAGGLVETGKVEQDVGLHGGKEREPGDLGSLVQKLSPGDAAVLALGAGPADDDLDHVHLVDHVQEGAHVGIRHLAALGDVAQRVEVLEQVVRELVPRSLLNDGGELLGLDEAVGVGVEPMEGLTDALALQAAQHLRELVVVHAVPLGLAADVQAGPLAVPVKRNAVGALVELVEPAEVVIFYGAEALDVEEAEGDLILGIGLVEDVLEVAIVGQGQPALVCAVGDVEQDRVLLALDFVLRRIRPLAVCPMRARRALRGTHVVFLGRGNRIDKLVRTEVQLAGLGILGGVTVEARLGLRRELLGLFGANERLLDSLLDGSDFGHGGAGDCRSSQVNGCAPSESMGGGRGRGVSAKKNAVREKKIPNSRVLGKREKSQQLPLNAPTRTWVAKRTTAAIWRRERMGTGVEVRRGP